MNGFFLRNSRYFYLFYSKSVVDLSTEPALKRSDDYTDNCHTDSETLNVGDFVFQENNRQRYRHNG